MRSGIQQLLAYANTGQITQVWREALDRISRDKEEIAKIYKHLQYRDVTLHTLSEGEINELHIGLKGTINSVFLKELSHKTKRDQVARVRGGKSGGGRCYGYDILSPGELAINEEQAAVVTRIYKMYGEEKMSARAIAYLLNAEGIAAPRGGEWRATTLHGSRRTQDGILHQTLYKGTYVYNRRSYKKHPDTGARSSRLNEASLHIIEQGPTSPSSQTRSGMPFRRA